MSLRLPGNPHGIIRLYGVFLLACVFSPIFAVSTSALESGEAKSGIVKPKISVISPQTVSPSPEMIKYTFPKKYSSPFGVTVDAKDRIWVTEMTGNSLAVLDPATNELKEYRIPSTAGLEEVDWEYDPRDRQTPDKTVTNYSVGNPGNLIIDKQGIVWFVMQFGNSVARFDPEKEEFTEFPIPTPNSQPYDLAADSKGRIWYVEKNTGSFGYLDYENRKSREIKLGQGSNIMGIAIDKEDNIWIGEVNGNYIGRYKPETKKFRKYPINVQKSQPGPMSFAADGLLWICNLRSQQLGVLMPDSGIYSVVNLPGWNAVPQALVTASDGMIWIVDSMTNQVGFFDPVKLTWHVFSIPIGNAQPMDLAEDSKGDIWFSMSDRNANAVTKITRSSVPKEIRASGVAPGEDKAAAKPAKASPEREEFPVIPVAIVLVALVAVFVIVRKVFSK